ncbi:hypothetical protein H0H93_007311, partial [Arthromyces matolae]
MARRTSAGAGVERFNDYANSLRTKYNKKGSKQGSSKNVRGHRRTVAGLSMVNQDADSSYYTTLTIGTPSQTPTFDATKSSSLVVSSQSTDIQYGSGEVLGELVEDVVTLGSFTIQKQVFLAVVELTSGLLDGTVSGLLGLAWPSIAATQSTPLWQALTNNNHLDSPEFSFYMTRFNDDVNANTEEPGGIFTLGGTNSTLFSGDIEFLDMPVNTPTFWLLQISAITVQGSKVAITTGTSALAAIDTGTTLIGGPSGDIAAIWAAVPGSQTVPFMSGFYSFPCTTDVTVTISFGGTAWPINTSDINIGQLSATSTQCVGAIFDLGAGSNIDEGSGNPNWVIGDTFL